MTSHHKVERSANIYNVSVFHFVVYRSSNELKIADRCYGIGCYNSEERTCVTVQARSGLWIEES
jgi:hypothetical protein